MSRPGLSLSLAVLIAGCANVAAEIDVPALLESPDGAARAELLDAAATLLGQSIAAIDSDALTRTSLLTFERATSGGRSAPPPLGRDLGRPIVLQIVQNGDACFLVRLDNLARERLRVARCRAEPQ